MSNILQAVLAGRRAAQPTQIETTRRGITNAQTRLEAVGQDPGKPDKPFYLDILDALGLPSRLIGTGIGKLTGFGGENVKEAVQNLLVGIGVPDTPMFEAEIPWFGGNSITFAPSLAGTVGTLADMFNPIDPLNRITFGLGKPGVVDDIGQGIASIGDDAVRAVKMNITNPFNKAKPLATLEPGALLGSARPAVSEKLLEAGEYLGQSSLGKAFQRRFGMGMATSALPKTLADVEAGYEGIRQMTHTIESLRGADDPLVDFLKSADELFSSSVSGMKTMSARQAARHIKEQTQILATLNRRVQDSFSNDIMHILDGFDQAKKLQVLKTMADPEMLKTVTPDVADAAAQLTKIFNTNHKTITARAIEIDRNLGEAIQRNAPLLDNYVPRHFARPLTKDLRAKLGIPDAMTLDDLNAMTSQQFYEMLKKKHGSLGARTLWQDVSDPSEINNMLAQLGEKPLYEQDILKIALRHVRGQVTTLNQLDTIQALTKQYGMNLENAGEYLLKNKMARQQFGVYELVSHKNGFTLRRVQNSDQMLDDALRAAGDTLGPAGPAPNMPPRAGPQVSTAARRKVKTPDMTIEKPKWEDFKKGMKVRWTEKGQMMSGTVVETVTRKDGRFVNVTPDGGVVNAAGKLKNRRLRPDIFDEGVILGEEVVTTVGEEAAKTLPGVARTMPGNTMVLPDEMAAYVNQFNRAVMEPEWAADGIGRLYRAYIQAFKAYTTVPLPGYWLRNKLGDMQLMWMADVNPQSLLEGGKLLSDPDNYRIMLRDGKSLTGRELMGFAEGLGLPEGVTSTIDDLSYEAMAGGRGHTRTIFSSKNPIGKMERAGRKWVDAHSRYSMLLDRIAKGDSLYDAAAMVKKHLYDYMDLTPFEKNVMRHIMPFYSWMRKNVPHQIEMLLTKPGKFTTLQKLRTGLSDAEPDESQVPSYIRESMGIPVKSASQETGFNFLMPRLPDEDLGRFGLGEILGALAAPIRLPFELATNQNIATGVPIKDRGETTLNSVLPYIGYQATPRAFTTILDALQSVSGVDVPWMEAERAGRRMSTTLSPVGIYPGDAAARGGQYEELERLLDIIKRMDLQGKPVPTLKELGR